MKRISTKLYGRLGNQMFQIATAWAYAQDKSLEFILPPSTLNEREWPYYWRAEYALGFKRTIDIEGYFLEAVYKELKPGYNPIPHYTDFLGTGFFNLITFDGYWQSYKYFNQYKNELKKLFKFDHQSAKPKIDNLSEYVAIHVRRGDYVEHASKFPPVTVEYLNEAIELFNCYNQYKFVVFSDDITWCKENLKSELSTIIFYPKGDDIEDQKAMYQCRGFIISNSTYSWWPAYFSENKIVIAPKNWFGPDNAHIAHNDLLPENWITI